MRTIARSLLSSPTSLTGSGLGGAILWLGFAAPLLDGQPLTRERIALGLVGLALVAIGVLSEDGWRLPWTKPPQQPPAGPSPADTTEQKKP